jgi:hypothetical protein
MTNEATQAEKREVLRNDTYFSRQSNTADDAGGRYAKLTPTKVTGSTPLPQVPQLPASSPWASGFDQNLERELGFSVDEMPAHEIQEPTLGVASSAGVGSEPVAEVSLPASSVIGSSIKRRSW